MITATDLYHRKILIPGLPKLPNELRYAPWRKVQRERDHWHTAVWGEFLSFGRKPPKPLERAELKLTRFSSREPDPDNLVASWKDVIDGLVKCGVLVDDKRENVHLVSAWNTNAGSGIKGGFVTIEVTER